MIKVLRKYSESKMLEKYSEETDRFDVFCSKFKTPKKCIDMKNFLINRNRNSVFTEFLKNDEYFLKVAKKRKLDYHLFSRLKITKYSNFNYLLKLCVDFDHIKYSDILNFREVLGDVSLSFWESSGFYENSENIPPWSRLVQLYKKHSNVYDYDFSGSNSYVNSEEFMESFIEFWRLAFSEKVQENVVRVLSEDISNFSIHNIYHLSMLSHNEEKSQDSEYSIFESPSEWILSMVELEDESSSNYSNLKINRSGKGITAKPIF